MKQLKLILACVLLAGCKSENESILIENNVAFTVMVIDSCEYIQIGTYGWAHKGNCKNPIHLTTLNNKKP